MYIGRITYHEGHHSYHGGITYNLYPCIPHTRETFPLLAVQGVDLATGLVKDFCKVSSSNVLPPASLWVCCFQVRVLLTVTLVSLHVVENGLISIAFKVRS